MSIRHWKAVLVAVIAAYFLIISSFAQAATGATQEAFIDLAKTTNNQELIGAMLAQQDSPGTISLSDAKRSTEWTHPGEKTLASPREPTTIWLKASLRNSSDQALVRWLVLEPWRINRIDAFFVDADTGKTFRQTTTGLAAPTQERAVNNGKAVIPVKLSAGETQQLYLKVYSESLPSISIKNWEAVAYSDTLNDNRIFQVALLAAILTLLIILASQFNASMLITGLWLFVAFIFETEKSGLFSFYLLGFLENYAINLRVSAWVFTEQLFLTASVFLLGLNGFIFWRRFLYITGLAALTVSALTFALDGGTIRNLGVLVTGLYAASWLLMLPATLRRRGKKTLPILSLLGIYWATSSFLLLGYTFNFYYTSAFASARIYIEIGIAVAVILTYNWQHKRQLQTAEKELKEREANSRKALEQAVQSRTEELNNALETAKKASTAKINFLGQVTHDLRSPLTAILGYAQLQAANTVSSHQANQVIQDRALYMKDLIDGLLNYAKDVATPDEEQRDIYLIAFIDNLVNQAHIIANKQNNRFRLRLDTDLPTVIQCSSTRLQRIVLNLLDNAAKYTEQGDITLSVALESNHDGTQSISFSVRDTGCGITPEQLQNIYTPFYQTSEHNPGTGLGLSICIELTKNLGGNLHIESEPGEGTLAVCKIPCIVGDEQLVTPSLPSVHGFLPSFNAMNQLAWVVEDSTQIRQLLGEELTDMGFEVELSATAEEFAESAARKDILGKPAVIITDYELPGASGTEVLHRARTRWPETPVFLLSATLNSNPQLISEGFSQFDAFLSKPIDLLELRLKLAKLSRPSSETTTS